jgi:hypothetical protein
VVANDNLIYNLYHIELILGSLESGCITLILVVPIAMLFKIFSPTYVMNSNKIGKCSCSTFDDVSSIFALYSFV